MAHLTTTIDVIAYHVSGAPNQLPDGVRQGFVIEGNDIGNVLPYRAPSDSSDVGFLTAKRAEIAFEFVSAVGAMVLLGIGVGMVGRIVCRIFLPLVESVD